MKMLKQVILQYAPSAVQLGDQAEPELPTAKLQEELRAISRSNERYFILCVLMVVGLFVVSVGIVISHLSEPGVVRAVLAGFGVSVAGLIAWMVRLWREKVATDILLHLAGTLKGATLRSIIAVLLKRL